MEHSAVLDRRVIDYDADDVLVVSDPEQIRALGDELRGKIVRGLRERARSVSELAEELGLPKGTVAHHVKVLEKAGLIRVVRTRQVRALTERYYGRVARLFMIQSEEYPDADRAFAASGLRIAAEELRPAREGQESSFGHVYARLSLEDAQRLKRRLDKLFEDFRAREKPDGDLYGFVSAIYPAEDGRA
jgi:DNA-binding transcriptional ArsR family regulator